MTERLYSRYTDEIVGHRESGQDVVMAVGRTVFHCYRIFINTQNKSLSAGFRAFVHTPQQPTKKPNDVDFAQALDTLHATAPRAFDYERVFVHIRVHVHAGPKDIEHDLNEQEQRTLDDFFEEGGFERHL